MIEENRLQDNEQRYGQQELSRTQNREGRERVKGNVSNIS